MLDALAQPVSARTGRLGIEPARRAVDILFGPDLHQVFDVAIILSYAELVRHVDRLPRVNRSER